MHNRWIVFLSLGVAGLIVFAFFAFRLMPIRQPSGPEKTIAKIEKPSVTFVNPAFGPADALVTIVDFSDFSCVPCRDLFAALASVQASYPAQVRVVWKNLPNESIHPEATPAAIAAHCADRQKKFWPYAEQLFLRQSMLSEDQFSQIARDLGLKTDTFQKCYDARDTLAIVRKDYEEGIGLGITATPTIFINDAREVGAVSLQELTQYVEQAIAAAKKK